MRAHANTHSVDKIRSKYREMEIAWLHFAAGQIMHFVTEAYPARSLNLKQHWNQHQSQTLLVLSATHTPLPFEEDTHTHTHKMQRKKKRLNVTEWSLEFNRRWETHFKESNGQTWKRWRNQSWGFILSVLSLIINHHKVMQLAGVLWEHAMIYWWAHFHFHTLFDIQFKWM